MKARITDKEAKDYVSFSIGYCNAQYLLRAYNPLYYTAGIYGRKSDIYYINGLYIATGYGPQGPRIDYNLTRKYDKKASEIWSNYDEPYEKRQKKVEKLLTKLLEKAKTQNQ